MIVSRRTALLGGLATVLAGCTTSGYQGPERTGLPFVVFISQRGGARHDLRVKVAHGARVRPSVTVAVRPAVRVIRGKLDVSDLALLRRWIELNQDVLVQYWHGVIEYTEDAIGALRPIDASAL